MEASSSMTEFALDLFNILRESSPETNTLISPISIVTALSMTLLGTAENTEKQMIESMKLKGKQLAKWHEALGALLTTLKSGKGDGTSAMNVANRIYIDEGYKVLDSYKNSLKKLYNSEYGSVAFSHDASGAKKIINEWVKDETKNKIPNLLESLSELTRVVLVNAVHFKGYWKNAFKKESEMDAAFHINSEKSIDVKMMFQIEQFPYSRNEYASAVKLQFKEEGYAMHFILPNERFGLKKLEDKLLKDRSALDALINSYVTQEIELSIPKFQMRSQFDLAKQLEALGMKDLFCEGRCDLSGVTGNRNLHVSSVIHEACLDVTEDGCEAVAATAVQMVLFCASLGPTMFIADQPFLVLISHNDSILFLGRVMEPKSS